MLGALAMRDTGKGEVNDWRRPAYFLMTIGWHIALSVAVPTAIGWWLDRPERFDTHPMFLLVGLGLGTMIAFYGLYQMLRRFQREQGNRERK